MTTVIPFHPIAPSFRPTGGPAPQTQLPYTQPQPQSQLQGKCIASRFRTKLCDKWLDNRGHCPYGARCMFAHGPQELRTTEMNIRDGLTDEETIRVFKRFVQLRNAGIEVQVPACLQRVDWGAGRRFVVTHAPPHGAVSPSETVSSRDSVRNASPASFRWCPYSTTQCKVYFDETGSLAGSGRASPAPTAESHSSDELPDFRLSPNLEYEI